MNKAEKFNIPIVTLIDTPGAYPGMEAEERGQGEAIARNIYEMMNIKVPIICLEGATIDMVVQYYESIQLHKQAQLDWMAENRAIEDYDYMKLQNGKVVI